MTQEDEGGAEVVGAKGTGAGGGMGGDTAMVPEWQPLPVVALFFFFFSSHSMTLNTLPNFSAPHFPPL